MAIRRVSDLPELTAQYPDASLGKCLLEVSYNNTGKLYQSFYVTARKLFDVIKGEIDTKDFVTKSTDQTITGYKRFNSPRGVKIIDDILKGVVTLSADINNITQENNKAASAKAVKDYVIGYCLDQGFITTTDDTWKEAIEVLKSMLSEDDSDYYVKNGTSEPTAQQDGTFAHPFKTMQQVVDASQKRRFIGKAQCNIHLLDDYLFTSQGRADFDNAVSFQHPDMTDERFFNIYGRKDNQEGSQVTVTIDYGGNIPSYTNPIACKCNCQFSYVHLVSANNGISISNYISSTPMSQREQKILEFSKAGTALYCMTSRGRADIADSTIEGFRWGIVGAGEASGECVFKNCTRCISAKNGSYSLHSGATLKAVEYCGMAMMINDASGSLGLSYRSALQIDSCRYMPIACANGGSLAITQADANSSYSAQTAVINANMYMGDETSTKSIASGLSYDTSSSADAKKAAIASCMKRLVGVDASQILTTIVNMNDQTTGLDSSSTIGRGSIGPGTVIFNTSSDDSKLDGVAKWLGLIA